MLVKHSVRIAGHATSVSLEEPFWQALGEIARLQGRSVNSILAEIDRGRGGNLSSAIRLFVLESCRRGELSHAHSISGAVGEGGVAGPLRRVHPARQDPADLAKESSE